MSWNGKDPQWVKDHPVVWGALAYTAIIGMMIIVFSAIKALAIWSGA